MKIDDVSLIASNRHGYGFYVGRIADRWIGFATELNPQQRSGLFVFAEVSEGVLLGVCDRDRAILVTSAVAQSVEHGYGGVDEWKVAEPLRGKPEDFRCKQCDELFCKGECLDFDFECSSAPDC